MGDTEGDNTWNQGKALTAVVGREEENGKREHESGNSIPTRDQHATTLRMRGSKFVSYTLAIHWLYIKGHSLEPDVNVSIAYGDSATSWGILY